MQNYFNNEIRPLLSPQLIDRQHPFPFLKNKEQFIVTELTDKEKEKALYSFDKPGKERTITQEMRQTAFDNFETTDDHGMLIMGIAEDQNGTPYYKVQNSWNTVPPYDGFWYFSKPFVAYKTTSIMVNKNAIPKEIAKKLGLK